MPLPETPEPLPLPPPVSEAEPLPADARLTVDSFVALHLLESHLYLAGGIIQLKGRLNLNRGAGIHILILAVVHVLQGFLVEIDYGHLQLCIILDSRFVNGPEIVGGFLTVVDGPEIVGGFLTVVGEVQRQNQGVVSLTIPHDTCALVKKLKISHCK